MKILFCGDVVGRSGREVVLSEVPRLKREMNLDAVVVNGDNAAAGFGITDKICKEFFENGVDVITGGDHIWDQKGIIAYIASETKLLRPANFPEKTAGKGHVIINLVNGKKLLVIHILGQVFHKENLDCPFAAVEKILEGYKLGRNIDAILLDVHAEATSEKTAFAAVFDGRVSAIVGSHTHIPTADYRILPNGTAYQTDTGMCGDYDSIIGFDKKSPMERFVTKVNKNRLEAAKGAGTLSALYVETDDVTGLAKNIEYLQIGGVLQGSPA